MRVYNRPANDLCGVAFENDENIIFVVLHFCATGFRTYRQHRVVLLVLFYVTDFTPEALLRAFSVIAAANNRSSLALRLLKGGGGTSLFCD